MKLVLIAVVGAVLVLVAGCGASKPVQKPTIEEQIRSDIGWDGHVTSARCTRHSCAITENDRVDGARSNWLGVLAEMTAFEDDDAYRHLRRVTILVTDTRRWRVAFFRCVVRHDNSPGSHPWHPCVERVHRLA